LKELPGLKTDVAVEHKKLETEEKAKEITTIINQ